MDGKRLYFLITAVLLVDQFLRVRSAGAALTSVG